METQGFQGDHGVNIIKLQVMFEWSLEWDCRGQISLPTGMGGKLKTTSSCTVVHHLLLHGIRIGSYANNNGAFVIHCL